MNKLPIGTRVHHTGHGDGVIVEYNGQKSNEYAMKNPGCDIVCAAWEAGLGQAIVAGYYGGDRFPYVIQFDSGYTDVYALDDVTEIK